VRHGVPKDHRDRVVIIVILREQRDRRIWRGYSRSFAALRMTAPLGMTTYPVALSARR
jgi:hypothetical protein